MPARFTSPRFVGRERELARLGDALENAAGGRPSTVVVTGTAGIGVTRLLDEAARRVAAFEQPFTVVRFRAWPGRTGEPYAPVLDGLRTVLAALPPPDAARLLAPGGPALASLLPDLAPAAGDGTGGGSIAPERRQARLLEAVHGLIDRLGERAPVLVVAEDLHVADHGTRALVAFLARTSRAGRICLAATYQPDQVTREHPLRAQIAALDEAARRPQRIELGVLGRDELADLIAEIEGVRPTAAVLLLVAERSQGNPLLAEEIVAARRDLAGTTLAGSLEEIVMARLGRRTPECRRVVRLLAPAEQPLSPAELAAVAAAYERPIWSRPPRSSSAPRRGDGPLDGDLATGLAEAVDHGFVVVDGAPPRDDGGNGRGGRRIDSSERVRLRHDLIGRAVAADLLPNQHRLNHVALAIALDDRHGTRARHWLSAHEPGRARTAALEAAGVADAVDAPGDALAALELALELGAAEPAEAGDDGHDGARLLVRAAETAFAAGRPGRATSFAESAIRRFDERADRLELGLLHERLGRYRRVTGDHAGAIAAHRRAVALVPAGPTRARATVLAGLAQALMLDGHFAEAERIAEDAIATARSVGPEARPEEGHALCTLGIVRAWGGDPASSITLLEEARSVALEVGSLDERFRAIANLTTAMAPVGRRAEAIDVALDGIEEAGRAGLDTVFGNFLRGNVADVMFTVGRWEEARAMSRTALEWSPAGVAFVDAAVGLATVEIEMAADDATGQLVGRLLLELETVPDPQYVVPASRAAASYALWRGDVADAARLVDLGWSHVRTNEDWIMAARMAAVALEVQAAIVADARERRDLSALAGARQRSGQILAEAQASVRNSGVARTVPSRREAEAFLAVAGAFRERVDGHDDAASWAALADGWNRLGNPYQAALARWRQAEAILGEAAAAGKDARVARGQARGPLREAYRIAGQLGARPLAARLAELAGRALIALPDRGAAARTATAEGRGKGAGGRGDGSTAPTDGVTLGSLASAFVGPPPVRRRDTFGLSSREREVLGLIVEGRTNREIGERLFISQKTVGVHVGNILAKLGVSGRVEAATAALRLGLSDRA
jgi:DNA-binding CsgD family transcriptional regulator/tetratricopeptide (TPR) repeat protein